MYHFKGHFKAPHKTTLVSVSLSRIREIALDQPEWAGPRAKKMSSLFVVGTVLAASELAKNYGEFEVNGKPSIILTIGYLLGRFEVRATITRKLRERRPSGLNGSGPASNGQATKLE